MKGIYNKLFSLQSEIGKISKDQTNPFYKSKYFDINQLIEHKFFCGMNFSGENHIGNEEPPEPGFELNKI